MKKTGTNVDLFVVINALTKAMATNKNLMPPAFSTLKSGRFFFMFGDNNPQANKTSVICPQDILPVWFPVALLVSTPLTADSSE